MSTLSCLSTLQRLTLPALFGIKRQQNDAEVMHDVGNIVKAGVTVPVNHVLALAPSENPSVTQSFVLICKQRPLQLWVLKQPPATLPTSTEVDMAVLGVVVPDDWSPEVLQQQISDPRNLLWLSHPYWDNQHPGNPTLFGAPEEEPADLLERCEKLDNEIKQHINAVLEARAQTQMGMHSIEEARASTEALQEWGFPSETINLQGLELDDLSGNLSFVANAYPLEDQLPCHPDIFKLWMIDLWMHQAERQPGPPSIEELLAVFDQCWKAAHNAGLSSLTSHSRGAEEEALRQLSEVLATPIGTSLEAKLMKLPTDSAELRDKAYTLVNTEADGRLAAPENRRAFCERLCTDLGKVTLF